MSNIDALLDATLDDIADLPELVNFPKGLHKALLSFKLKENTTAVIATLKYIEPLDLFDAEAVAPTAGSIATCRFDLANEYGQGNFKRIAKPLREALNLGSNRELIEGVKDIEVAIETSLRPDKKKPEVVYMEILDLVVQ